MAHSRFEYVKGFERDDVLLPRCYVVVRLDGRAFTKLTAAAAFTKPSDDRGLRLMNHAAAVRRPPPPAHLPHRRKRPTGRWGVTRCVASGRRR